MMLSDDVDYCGELDGNCAKDDDNDDDDDGRKMDGTTLKMMTMIMKCYD